MQLRHHRVPHAVQRERIDLLGARVPEAPAVNGTSVLTTKSSCQWRTAHVLKQLM